MGIFEHSMCDDKVRGIQDYHMDAKGWDDVAYSAIACPHGYLYECRWLGHRTAANGTEVGNDTAYAICYLGGEGDPFTEQAKVAIRAGADYLDSHGAGPNRNGHRDWKNTECPGDTIYNWVHAGMPAGSLEEDDLLSALTDDEQRELLRKVREVWNETAANPQDAADCRLKDTTIKVREIHDAVIQPGG